MAPEANGHAETARRMLADCDARLDRYREALERGVDAALVARRISEIQLERSCAEEELRLRRPAARAHRARHPGYGRELADLVGVLEAAEP
jgi:site-specific DNA recombinase